MLMELGGMKSLARLSANRSFPRSAWRTHRRAAPRRGVVKNVPCWRGRRCDAERRQLRYHAERGNEEKANGVPHFFFLGHLAFLASSSQISASIR